jgi:hypothetical protein
MELNMLKWMENIMIIIVIISKVVVRITTVILTRIVVAGCLIQEFSAR